MSPFKALISAIVLPEDAHACPLGLFRAIEVEVTSRGRAALCNRVTAAGTFSNWTYDRYWLLTIDEATSVSILMTVFNE